MKKFLLWLLGFFLAAYIHEWLAVAYLIVTPIVVVVAWLYRGAFGNNQAAPGADAAPAETPAPRGATHEAPAPQGTPAEPWAVSGGVRLNAVGESHYPDGFRAALRTFNQPLTPEGVELPDVRAAVVTDPHNPYDGNAVAVWIEGRHLVGYLPSEMAAQYAPALRTLESEGNYLRVPARVWVAERNGVFGSVSLSMPSPDGVLSFNEMPEDDPYQVLPPGRALQVTGEEEHMDVLTRYVSDRPRHLAVTLHEATVEGKTARSQPASVVEVRLDGERVGCLTKAMSEHVRDLVAYVDERGHLPVARAVLKGSSIKADLTLHVARSSEVSQAWLDNIPDRRTNS